MEKEQSTSVAVANSNHLSSTAAFSAGKQFAPFHLTPFSLQCSLHFFLHFQVFSWPPGMLFEFSLVYGMLLLLLFLLCFFFFLFNLLPVLLLHFFTAILMYFKIFKSTSARKEWSCHTDQLFHGPINSLVYSIQGFSYKEAYQNSIAIKC